MTGASKAFDDAKEILPPIVSDFFYYKEWNFQVINGLRERTDTRAAAMLKKLPMVGEAVKTAEVSLSYFF